MNLNLSNKNAIVGGSSQGIGKATAIELSKLGASIILLARNEILLKETLTELDVSKGQSHQYIVVDFSDLSEMKGRVGEGLKKFGRPIHILVNNAGGPPGGNLLEFQSEDFISAMTMHLLTNHELVKILIDGMKKEQYGRIINIISTSVKIPLDNLGLSNTTRGAVASWAKTLSNELGPFGITVNNVLPGFTDTARLKSLFEQRAQMAGVSYENLLEKLKMGVPLRRIADPIEVAAMAAFLASPAASYVNGTSIRVDGGRTGSI